MLKMSMSIRTLLTLFLSLGTFCSTSMALAQSSTPTYEEIEKKVKNFGQITDGIYRSAQPTTSDLKLLKEFGIKTVINFRHEPEVSEAEKMEAYALGLHYYHIPWRIQKHPDNEPMKQFLDVIKRSDLGPFLVHCRRGSERTGVADAIYRHFVEGLSTDEAWERATENYHVKFYWRPFIKNRFKDFTAHLNELKNGA